MLIRIVDEVGSWVGSLCIYRDDRDSVRRISSVLASQLDHDCVRWGLDLMNRLFAVFGARIDARKRTSERSQVLCTFAFAF